MIYLLMIPTVVMILSDFRNRRISLYPLLLLSALCLPISIYMHGFDVVMSNVIINIILFSYLGCSILGYLLIRYRRFINPLRTHIGLGDILFVLVLTPLFPPKDFVIFLLSSMVVGLIWWLVSGRNEPIPLVSFFGISLGFYLITL